MTSNHTPVGLALNSYQKALKPVRKMFNRGRSEDGGPGASFDVYAALGEKARRYIEAEHGDNGVMPTFSSIASHLPLAALSALSFDQLCKVHYSSLFMMDQSVCDLFEKSQEHILVRKIESSMWRWGFSRGKWNDVVAAHVGIRNFDLGLEDFEVRLDHTTYVNECGYSEHSRTFLDGVFAYLVHYRGEHVMTIGFSVAADRRILIQQVQLVNRRGNRFLFRMPTNRLEHIIACFAAAFPGHDLYVVDGRAVGTKSLRSYEDALARAKRRLVNMRAGDAYSPVEEIATLEKKAAHLRADLPRLEAQYGETGRYQRGAVLAMNSLDHYLLAA